MPIDYMYGAHISYIMINVTYVDTSGWLHGTDVGFAIRPCHNGDTAIG